MTTPASLSDELAAMGKSVRELTPVEARALLPRYPDDEDLRFLDANMDHYMKECNGIFCEGFKAVLRKDLAFIKTLYNNYSFTSVNADAQLDAVYAAMYKSVLVHQDVAWLKFLDSVLYLYNVPTFNADVLAFKRTHELDLFLAALRRELHPSDYASDSKRPGIGVRVEELNDTKAESAC